MVAATFAIGSRRGSRRRWSNRGGRVGLLDFGLECVERLGPELIEPGPELAEPFRVDLVDVPSALRLVDHEPRVLQDLEVLRHGRPADRQLARELADRARRAREPLEDLAPGRVGEGREGDRSVSHTLL